MVRVVCPGGTVTAYAWDMYGGGFSYEALQVEMRALGIAVPLPPSSGASRIDAMPDLWTDAGLHAVETREITVQRTFADFDDYWTTILNGAKRRPQGRSKIRPQFLQPPMTNVRVSWKSVNHAKKNLSICSD
jgi:hypothetical protein